MKTGADFIDLPIIQEHLATATDTFAAVAGSEFRKSTEGVLRYFPSMRFDSPLEVLFWIWWEAALGLSEMQNHLDIHPQVDVEVADELYRLDFVVEPTDPQMAASPDWTPIAVELDGHAFHERTREQVALRDSRDRALQVAGWKVFHFSFAEFTAAPGACVVEVATYAKVRWNKTTIRTPATEVAAQST